MRLAYALSHLVAAKISPIVCIIMTHTQLVGIVNQIMSKWQTFARVDMQQQQHHHHRQQQSIINTNSFVALPYTIYIVVKIDNHMNIWLASKSFIFIRFICLILEYLLAFACVAEYACECVCRLLFERHVDGNDANMRIYDDDDDYVSSRCCRI